MIRVALVDDHPAVLTGLRRFLDPVVDLEILAAAPDAASLARRLDGRRPDVLILDDDPAGGVGLSTCWRAKCRPESPRVLLYTAYATPAFALAARAAQADGVLDKSASAPALARAIRRVADGETVMPPVRREDFERAVARLADDDLPVFAMLLDRTSLADIAESMRLSEREAAHRARRVIERLRPRLDADVQGSISPRRIA